MSRNKREGQYAGYAGRHARTHEMVLDFPCWLGANVAIKNAAYRKKYPFAFHCTSDRA